VAHHAEEGDTSMSTFESRIDATTTGTKTRPQNDSCRITPRFAGLHPARHPAAKIPTLPMIEEGAA
jgi:hypothetical protein